MPRLLATVAAILLGAALSGSAEALAQQNKTSRGQMPHAPAPKYPGKRMPDLACPPPPTSMLMSTTGSTNIT